MLEVVSIILLLLMPLLAVFVVAVYLIVCWRERKLSPEEKDRRTELRYGMDKKQARQWRYAYGFMIFVYLLVLGFIVFNSWQGAKERQADLTMPEQKQSITDEAIDTSDFTLSEVEGWQTYRNEELGFEVKYPSISWMAEPNEKGVQLVDQESLSKAIARQEEFDGTSDIAYYSYYSYERVRISVSDMGVYDVYDYDSEMYDSALEAYLYITWKQNVLQETVFRGYPAFEVLVGGYGQNYTFFVEKDGLVYNIDFPFAGDKEHFNDTERTILSTFRFVE